MWETFDLPRRQIRIRRAGEKDRIFRGRKGKLPGLTFVSQEVTDWGGTQISGQPLSLGRGPGADSGCYDYPRVQEYWLHGSHAGLKWGNHKGRFDHYQGSAFESKRLLERVREGPDLIKAVEN